MAKTSEFFAKTVQLVDAYATTAEAAQLAETFTTACRSLTRRAAFSTMVKAPLPPPATAQLVDLTADPRVGPVAARTLWAANPSLVLVLRRPG